MTQEQIDTINESISDPQAMIYRESTIYYSKWTSNK